MKNETKIGEINKKLTLKENTKGELKRDQKGIKIVEKRRNLI